MLFTPKKLDLNEADSTDNVTKENKPSTPQKTPEIQNEPKTPEPKNEPKTPEKTPERKLRRRTTGNMTPKQRLHRYVWTQAGLQIGALNLASDWLSLHFIGGDRTLVSIKLKTRLSNQNISQVI